MIRAIVIALFSGVLFGAGLAVSGMADPGRVRGFLDVFGDWDATLAFVMGGALVVMAAAWLIKGGMPTPLAAGGFVLPQTRRVDARLLSGATLFGVGWGVSGLCPGPAIADLALAPRPAAVFVVAMLVGMLLHRLGARRLAPLNLGPANANRRGGMAGRPRSL